VRLYLELQQKRFSDRLSVILPKPEDMVDAWVPSLIMQPLVEKAVVHGLAGHQGPVTVRLTVGRVGDSLVLRVTNTIAAGKIVGPPGIGVSNVRERLAVQFEGRASLIAGPVEREWVSEITLPEIHASPERRTARPASALMPA
jgi:two-component system sensor histidine kinase AlgZ